MPIPDHPDIASAERTGYPTWNQPREAEYYCGECGRELTSDMYEDEHYEYLCEDCLLMLHKKG